MRDTRAVKKGRCPVIRYAPYGLRLLRLLKFDPGQAPDWVKARAPILCTCCGAVMKIVKTRIPPMAAVVQAPGSI